MIVLFYAGVAIVAGTVGLGRLADWNDDSLAEVRSAFDSGAANVALTFSPNWPFADAVFRGVTSQRVPCERIAVD